MKLDLFGTLDREDLFTDFGDREWQNQIKIVKHSDKNNEIDVLTAVTAVGRLLPTFWKNRLSSCLGLKSGEEGSRSIKNSVYPPKYKASDLRRLEKVFENI